MPGILQKAAGGDADAVVSSSSAELMETVSSVTEAVLLWLLLSVDCVQLEDCDRISAGIGDDDDSDGFTGVLTVSFLHAKTLSLKYYKLSSFQRRIHVLL